jgi:hypothetical protein
LGGGDGERSQREGQAIGEPTIFCCLGSFYTASVKRLRSTSRVLVDVLFCLEEPDGDYRRIYQDAVNIDAIPGRLVRGDQGV